MTAQKYHEEEALGKAYDSRLMKRLLTYLRPYRWAVVVSVFLLLLGSALQVAIPLIIGKGIDRFIVPRDSDGLGEFALFFGLAVLVLMVAHYAQLYLTNWLGQHVLYDIRMQVFRHVQRLHPGYFDKHPVGRILTRVTNDVNVLNEMFSSGVVTVIGDIFMLALIVGIMLHQNWQLALITFAVLPFLVVASFLFRLKVRNVYRDVRLRLARLNSFVQEHISGMRIVQLFNREGRTYRDFDNINRELRNAHHRSIYNYAVFYPTVEFLGVVSVMLVLYFGGMRITGGTLTFGELTAFLLWVERFYRPIMDLSEKYNILQNSMASSERIFQLLDTRPAIVDPPSPKRIESFAGRIELDHVWFAYNDDNWVLKDVTFSVEPGEKLAIVGATGAGKSSLVSLLFRFYDYQKGSIKLDGVDLKDTAIDDLRGHLGLVLQDVFLFSGTLAGNVRLKNDGITDEQVLQALERVGYSRFLNQLPDGLRTEIRERGATLSTGQKQLLSFARALAFDPGILILDEATSSVDTETELLIQKALEELLAGRTAIVIAHRLSTIEKADKIVVLHHGQVREIGRHDELLQRKGIYHKLYQMQYRRQLPSGPLAPTGARR